MPGGKRAGAGRKPGSKNNATIKLAEEAAAKGITPIEVLLNTMRLSWERSERDGHNGADLLMALSCAEKAAPYVHARIQAVAHSGSVDAKVTGRLVVTWGGEVPPGKS